MMSLTALEIGLGMTLDEIRIAHETARVIDAVTDATKPWWRSRKRHRYRVARVIWNALDNWSPPEDWSWTPN